MSPCAKGTSGGTLARTPAYVSASSALRGAVRDDAHLHAERADLLDEFPRLRDKGTAGRDQRVLEVEEHRLHALGRDELERDVLDDAKRHPRADRFAQAAPPHHPRDRGGPVDDDSGAGDEPARAVARAPHGRTPTV